MAATIGVSRHVRKMVVSLFSGNGKTEVVQVIFVALL